MLDYWVSLNTQNTVFQPNSQVTAIVHLETDKILKARKIDISVIGIAKTAWEECVSAGDVIIVISYGDEIYYINGYAILWKSSDGKNILPRGKYQFPLTFTIPENAPPSMNGKYGSISYRIQTNIEIPWASNEKRFCEFSVCPIIDLNLDRQLSQSVTTKSMKIQSSCCCCSSYPLELLVSMPKTGYTPGENIALKIKIINKTSWKMSKFEIGIIENLSFTAHVYYSKKKVYNKFSSNVVTAKTVIVDSEVDETKTFYLTVPPLTPTYHECRIIQNDYSLFVKVFTNAVFSSGPKVLLPLTIGSIPIREPSASTSKPTEPLQTIVEANAEKDDEEFEVSPEKKKKSETLDV